MAAAVLLLWQGLPEAGSHAVRLGAQAGIGAVVYVVVLLGRVIREARRAA
jgi:hypothetical protein